jgi:two-component system response regulator AtoC
VGITTETLAILKAYEFPGNVRELANTIERAVIVATESRIQAADLPEAMRASVRLQRGGAKQRTLAELEADYIVETLEATNGNKTEAARVLGISRKNLDEKIARYGIAVGGKRKSDTDD